MIKLYALYDNLNNIRQFIKCDEAEIELYDLDYIEVELEDFSFNPKYVYKIIDGKISIKERVDNSYLMLNKKLEIQDLFNAIEVEYNGIMYQGDEKSQGRLNRVISTMSDTEVTQWKAKDNSIHNCTKYDLQCILRLSVLKYTDILIGA